MIKAGRKKMSKKYLLIFLVGLLIFLYFIFSNKISYNFFSEDTSIKSESQSVAYESKEIRGTNISQSNEDIYTSDDYSSFAIKVDDEFRERFDNVFPVIPVDKLENEFKDSEEIELYIDSILQNVESHTIEAMEIANLCNNKRKVISRASDKSQNLKLYYDALFQNCGLVTQENDIFFIVEKLAFSGNTFEQLNYLDSLNNAILRKVFNPLANPYEYIEKRDVAISWLNQLASKGVVSAYEKLANLYMSGHNVEKDYVLSYFYASKASENALVTDYSDFYFNRLKSKMSKADLDRLKRILNR